MKKLLLLLTVLLTGVGGAWASVTQPTLTTDEENPVYYVIKNYRTNKYATYVNSSSQLTQEVSLTKASLWYFLESGEGVSIVPANDPTLKLASNSSATAAGSTWYLKENPYNSGYFCVSLNADLSGNCWDDQGNQTKIGYYNPRSNDYEGTSWVLERMGYTTGEVNYSFDTSNGSFYQGLSTLKTESGQYCNLWLSKLSTSNPQLKIQTNDAAASAGNNMNPTGGLYAKSSNYIYNLTISEGYIKSYTIIGTAAVALSINGTNYSASEAVNQKITLAEASRTTALTLKAASTAGWLNVTTIKVEYESFGYRINNVSDLSDYGVYTVLCYDAPRGGFYAKDGYLDACGGFADNTYPRNPAVGVDATDGNQQIAVFTNNGKRYLYNLGTSKFVGQKDDIYFQLTNTPTASWTISNGTGGFAGYLLTQYDDDNTYMTTAAWWNKDHAVFGGNLEAASYMLVSKVGVLTTAQKSTIKNMVTKYLTLMETLDKIEDYSPIGTGYGEYSQRDLDINTSSARDTYVNNIRSSIASATIGDIESTQTQADKFGLNTPVDNSLIRIKSAHNTYLTAGNPATRMTFTAAGSIFLYNSNKLLSYPNGYYAGMATNPGSSLEGVYVANIGTTPREYTFVESSVTAGKYGIYFYRLDDAKRFLYAHSGEGGNANQNTNEDANCVFTLEAVSSLPITFKGKYASFYSPVDLSLPSGVKAYTGMLDGENSKLVLTEQDYVPANTGVILEFADFSSETTKDFTIRSTVTPVLGTSLKGYTTATSVDDDATMVLGKDGEDWGIYKYRSGSGSATLGGFKAYMDTPDTPVKGFTFSFDDETGINTVQGTGFKVQDSEIYNLAGQKMSRLQKGVNIVNGKKVLVK